MRKQWRNGTRFAVYLLQIFPNVTEGLTMKRRGLIAFAAAGVIIGGAWLITATAIRAQQQPAPAAPPTQAVPPIGPADPNLQIVPVPDGKKVHLLPATLETTQWGWFNNAQPPVLRINSGDTVVMETMMHSHNQVIPGTTIEQIKKLRTDFPGRGPHTLTGPIYIEGAEPGDVLKVTINKIVPRAYAANFNVPGMFGQFPQQFQDGQVRYMYLDLDKMQTEFIPGVVVPVRPFPGILGVARAEPGQYSSVPPGRYAGNLDIRELVAGTSLYVPVFVKGALLWSGDSHAGQGNGEINLTAIETAYKEFNITVEVLKGTKLEWPRIETPTHWITIGYDQKLNVGWDLLKAETSKFLAETRKVSKAEADKIMVRQWDCRISEVVNVVKGTYCMNPKSPRNGPTLPGAENAQYYVTVTKDSDLDKAMDGASMAMINLLQEQRKLTRLDAYGLASIAMDCRIAPPAAGDEKSVHCLLPKSVFVARR
jgi:acetamidase/formamidase